MLHFIGFASEYKSGSNFKLTALRYNGQVKIFEAYSLETLCLRHICRVSEAELKRLPLFQKGFLRVNKAHTEDVKTEVKLETAAAMLLFFFYLFASAAISQSIPPHRKGSFHTVIVFVFPSPSWRLCDAE